MQQQPCEASLICCSLSCRLLITCCGHQAGWHYDTPFRSRCGFNLRNFTIISALHPASNHALFRTGFARTLNLYLYPIIQPQSVSSSPPILLLNGDLCGVSFTRRSFPRSACMIRRMCVQYTLMYWLTTLSGATLSTFFWIWQSRANDSILCPKYHKCWRHFCLC